MRKKFVVGVCRKYDKILQEALARVRTYMEYMHRNLFGSIPTRGYAQPWTHHLQHQFIESSRWYRLQGLKDIQVDSMKRGTIKFRGYIPGCGSFSFGVGIELLTEDPVYLAEVDARKILKPAETAFKKLQREQLKKDRARSDEAERRERAEYERLKLKFG